MFGVNTPQAFYDNLIATQPDPKTGKPDPEKMAAFLESHPETVKATKVLSRAIRPRLASTTARSMVLMRSGSSTRRSFDAGALVDGAGAAVCTHEYTGPAQRDKNYLFDALIASILQHPLQWHLIITIGHPGDPTNDATIPWPDGREQVDVGTLTLDHVESEETSPARDINFDPLVLPSGIAPSDDPLLSARSAVYSQSFTRRAGEKKKAERDQRLLTRESEHEHGHPAVAIYGAHEVVSLADGRDGPDYAWYWSCNGGIARRLPSPGFNPSPIGYLSS